MKTRKHFTLDKDVADALAEHSKKTMVPQSTQLNMWVKSMLMQNGFNFE